MIGKLYVHVADANRFLLVRRDTAFPYARFDRSEWRVVAVGVEPMSKAGEQALRADSFIEYRVPTIN